MDPLETITTLSHEFGSSDYVRAGGGNTSVKDEQALWVKPSGTTLIGMTPESFLPLNRARIEVLYSTKPPAEANLREELVKNLMQEAVCEGATGRPSVEAPLHNVFKARYVVHTHPALVNGMTCAQEGEQQCRMRFPDALWFPYTDPGYTLCMAVREALLEYEQAHGKQPETLVLQNHGIFIAADTPEEIRERYAEVMNTLTAAYAKTNTSIALPNARPLPSAKVAKEIDLLQSLLGPDAAHVCASTPFTVTQGPLTPDHIVYAKSYAYDGPLTAEGLSAFQHTHGYNPRVVKTDKAILGLGSSDKNAGLALELALDASFVASLCQAFGGIHWMSDQARSFIENWEVESYRQQMAGK